MHRERSLPEESTALQANLIRFAPTGPGLARLTPGDPPATPKKSILRMHIYLPMCRAQSTSPDRTIFIMHILTLYIMYNLPQTLWLHTLFQGDSGLPVYPNGTHLETRPLIAYHGWPQVLARIQELSSIPYTPRPNTNHPRPPVTYSATPSPTPTHARRNLATTNTEYKY